MKKILGVFILCFVSTISHAQGIKDIRINEILVHNINNYQDEYGEKCSWFELYNTGYSTVNLGGCYLTNDPDNPKKYRLPKSDYSLVLKPQSYVIFYAYDKPTRGSHHVNFFLTDTNKKGYAYLAIYDQGGKVLIDSVTYHVASQKADISIGKLENATNPIWQEMSKTTPRAINNTDFVKTRSEIYEEKDRYGVIITITSMGVVFTILLLVAIIYKFTGLYFKRKEKKDNRNAPTKTSGETQTAEIKQGNSINELEEMAAIAMVLHLHIHGGEKHETENNGFYLQSNTTSPWGNKSLTFKKTPIIKK